MALTEIIAATVSADTTDITLSGPVTIVAGEFSTPTLTNDESIVVWIKKLSGAYIRVKPDIVLSNKRNTAILDATGDYRFIKSATANAVDLGYE